MKYSCYYINQVKKNYQNGGNLKVFKGSHFQHGYGLGSIFKTLQKGISYLLPVLKTNTLPALKSGAETLGKHLIKTATSIVNDKLDGISFNDSIKNRTSETINTLKNKLVDNLKGSGLRKKKKIDIFD